MKDDDTYGRRIKGINSFSLVSCQLSWLEFEIRGRGANYSFEVRDCYDNLLLTGINLGTVSEVQYDIKKLKEAIHIPSRIHIEIIEDVEGGYFVVEDKQGYPIASSGLLFSPREFKTVLYWLRLQLPTTTTIYQIDDFESGEWVLNEE